jgi:hypothetical protein
VNFLLPVAAIVVPILLYYLSFWKDPHRTLLRSLVGLGLTIVTVICGLMFLNYKSVEDSPSLVNDRFIIVSESLPVAGRDDQTKRQVYYTSYTISEAKDFLVKQVTSQSLWEKIMTMLPGGDLLTNLSLQEYGDETNGFFLHLRRGPLAQTDIDIVPRVGIENTPYTTEVTIKSLSPNMATRDRTFRSYLILLPLLVSMSLIALFATFHLISSLKNLRKYTSRN